MTGPLLSVVIANYNYGRFLEEAICSVLNQGVNDEVELIVCDAGSSDGSVEIIQKYQDRISWWCSERDRGQSDAFNKGFSHARGKYLTWLNADDVFTPGALRAVLTAMKKHPECEWFAGSSLYADKDLRVEDCFCAHHFSALRAKYAFLSVGGPSSFFSKRIYQAVGGINESLHYAMDVDLWLRFYHELHVTYRRVVHNVWAYRRHENSKMSGIDCNPTDKAIEDRRKATIESDALDAKYGVRHGFKYNLVQIISYSIVDGLIVWWRNMRWRGRSALEI